MRSKGQSSLTMSKVAVLHSIAWLTHLPHQGLGGCTSLAEEGKPISL